MKSKTAMGKFTKGWVLVGILSLLASPAAQAASDDSLREAQLQIDRDIRKLLEEQRENRSRIVRIRSGAEDQAPEFKGACDRTCRSTQGSCTSRDFQSSGVEPLVEQPVVELHDRSDYACLAIYDANPTLSGLSPSCAAAISKCGEVAKAQAIARLEARNGEIDHEVRERNEDRRELTRAYSKIYSQPGGGVCVDCMKPTTGQIAVGLASALAPVAVAGIGAWQANQALNAQVSLDQRYYKDMLAIGVPPQRASLFGGYESSMLSGSGAFGWNVGFGNNPYAAVNPFALNSYGFNPYGPGVMNPWTSGVGLNVGLTLNSPWNAAMYNPYASLMNPWATGSTSGGWINGNIGLNLNAPWAVAPWSQGRGGGYLNPAWMDPGPGLAVANGPWMDGGYNAYYLQIQQQQQMMMMQQQQAQAQMQMQVQMQMQMQYQQQMQVQYQAYLQAEMQRRMQAAQAQQDLVIAQQQMQEAQMRYYQSMQGGMSWSGGLNFGVQVGFGSSNPWYSGSINSGGNCQRDWQNRLVCGSQGIF